MFKDKILHLDGGNPETLDSLTGTSGNKVILTRNDTYWDKDSVKLDKLELLHIEEETSGMIMQTKWECGSRCN